MTDADLGPCKMAVCTVAITITEASTLERLESVIQHGLINFIKVGQALLEIRGAKLYRETHDTFEAYCRDRWDMSRQNAHELISAAEVAANLSGTPDISPLTSVSQARPLAALDPAQQREAYAEAQAGAAAEGKPVTAERVRKAVAKRNGTAEPALPHAPGTISDEDLDKGDIGNPVKRVKLAFRECDERQQIAAFGCLYDEAKGKNRVVGAALFLSSMTVAELQELNGHVRFSTLMEAIQP